MIRGLYTAATGMKAEMARTDVISNNVANANTIGFKKDRAIFKAYPEMNIHRFFDTVEIAPHKNIDKRPFIGHLGTGVFLDEVNVKLSQGSIRTTGNAFDISISDKVTSGQSDGNSFCHMFEVETPQGIRYTRDGSFAKDAEGFLVTKEGYFVRGENGRINIAQGTDFKVSKDGEIFLDGVPVARLSIVRFSSEQQPIKHGDNLYSGQPQRAQATEYEVLQETIEESNVNAVIEMVDLISAFRAYEANQKVIKAHDELIERAVNDIARI